MAKGDGIGLTHRDMGIQEERLVIEYNHAIEKEGWVPISDLTVINFKPVEKDELEIFLLEEK